MSDPHVLIDAKYEERVRIKHLSMDPSLQGAKAQFEFEKHQIEIALPTLPSEDKRKLERIPVMWKRSLHVGSNWRILAY